MRAPEFWSGHDLMARLAIAALTPLGWLYGASVTWKAAHAQPHRPAAKVICIGNLTAGGSGKTPVALAVARLLMARGLKPVFLTRGYRGRVAGPAFVDPAANTAEDVGDEPLLLARAAPVIVSRNRAAGAALADANGFDAIVMDDGHQNFDLIKDLSLVVVDAESGFGNGHVLPAGPLRENVAQGLARADAAVLVGDGAPSLKNFHGPVLRAHLKTAEAAALKDRRVVAFAGIGRPQKFFDTLKALGADVRDARRYADHHAYTAAEIARLQCRARDLDAALVTTEKDFVRLPPVLREGIAVLPVAALFDDAAAFEHLLARLLPQTSGYAVS
ncbi:MAG: tetraacyldisaccharide 4'-kinase [Pseudomonadota bacterium]|nr:tetraacyldisaccharide 4'-kinase [Pseudomonadota bacterium]